MVQVFVPAVKSSDDRKEVSEVAHAVHDAPLFQLIEIINMLLFGWYAVTVLPMPLSCCTWWTWARYRGHVHTCAEFVRVGYKPPPPSHPGCAGPCTSP